MDLSEKEKRLAQLDIDLAAAHALLHEVATQRNALNEEINNEKLAARLAGEGISPKFLMSLDWWTVTGDYHKTLTKWFYDNYNHRGLFHSGIWAETNQMALKLMLDQNRPLEDQLGILDFVAFIKPDQDNEKPIGIFEHTLSERASWSLIVLPDGKVELLRNRFEDREFKDLNTALRYVYDHHPYTLRKGSRPEED